MLNRIPMTSLRAGSLNDIKESYSVALPVIAKRDKLYCLLPWQQVNLDAGSYCKRLCPHLWRLQQTTKSSIGMEWPRSTVFWERRENCYRKGGRCAPCVKSPRTIWNKLRMKSFGLAFFDDDFWTSLCCCRPWFKNLKEVPKGCALLSAFLRTCCSTATLS